MNRKLYALLLPVIGGAVIVGSGFSAWYFNEATVSKSTEGTGTVEGLIDTGVLTIKHETSWKITKKNITGNLHCVITH